MLFHSPPGVLFTFPSRYWFAIGRRRVFRIGGWSPRLRAGFPVAGPTRDRRHAVRRASPTGLSPCSAGLPRPFGCAPDLSPRPGPWGPGRLPPQPRRTSAPRLSRSLRFGRRPLSLAATRGISVDFSSSAYLDVSVRRVAPRSVCVRLRAPGHCPRRVPPFGHPGIAGRLLLPRDYRGLPRPSSASCAKASAARPSRLRFSAKFHFGFQNMVNYKCDGCFAYRNCIAIADATLAGPPRGAVTRFVS